MEPTDYGTLILGSERIIRLTERRKPGSVFDKVDHVFGPHKTKGIAPVRVKFLSKVRNGRQRKTSGKEDRKGLVRQIRS